MTEKKLLPRSTLHDQIDITKTSAITLKLDALLKAEGFTPLSAGRMDGPEVYSNHLEYIRGKLERVYITTHEPKSSKGQVTCNQGSC
jgi:hypothetical protein